MQDRILLMVSCPPSDKYRIASATGKSPARKASHNIKKLRQEHQLLEQYDNEACLVSMCFADGLQAYSALLERLFSLLCRNYYSEIPDTFAFFLNGVFNRTISELNEDAQLTEQHGLNEFCRIFFGNDVVAISKDFPNKKIINLLDDGYGIASINHDYFNKQRQIEIDKYKPHREVAKGQNINLCTWEEFIEDQNFNRALSKVYEEYHNNEEFKSVVDSDTAEYVNFYMKKLEKAKLQLTEEQARNIRTIVSFVERDYLLEEAAVMRLWSTSSSFSHIAYAHELNCTLDFVIRTTNLTFVNTEELQRNAQLKEQCDEKTEERLSLGGMSKFSMFSLSKHERSRVSIPLETALGNLEQRPLEIALSNLEQHIAVIRHMIADGKQASIMTVKLAVRVLDYSIEEYRREQPPAYGKGPIPACS